jgi:hypothetical protein
MVGTPEMTMPSKQLGTNQALAGLQICAGFSLGRGWKQVASVGRVMNENRAVKVQSSHGNSI